MATRSAALLRTAYLLVGDRGKAEDLLQTALIKTYLSWHRIRDHGALDGYVRRTLATTATSWWRRRWHAERPTATIPDGVAEEDVATERVDRDTMWRALASLPARQRAVLVLRFYEDLDEREIAETLGISRGTVKAHASRGLATLRGTFGKGVLGEVRA